VPGIGWLIGFVESWSVGDAVYFTFVTGLLFRGPYRVSKILLRKHPRVTPRPTGAVRRANSEGETP